MVSNIFTSTPVYKNVSGNLPKGLPVNWVECDPFDPANRIFAGTDYGLYITEDGGLTWTKDLRIPNTVISTIKVHKNKKDIYFFTHGRGIFKGQINNLGYSSVNSVTTVQSKVYPNPASQVLHLNTGGRTGNFEIWDYQGRILLTGKVTEDVQQINISNLNNGQYLLRFTDGGSEEWIRIQVLQ